MRRKVLLPEWLKGTVSCRRASQKRRHCLCSGSWPLAGVSGARQQSRRCHLLGRWPFRHVGLVFGRTCAITQVSEAKLAVRCCVLPPETLSMQEGTSQHTLKTPQAAVTCVPPVQPIHWTSGFPCFARSSSAEKSALAFINSKTVSPLPQTIKRHMTSQTPNPLRY